MSLPIPIIEFQGPEKPLKYENFCPEAASRVLFGLFLSNVRFVKKAFRFSKNF